jgi:hypothetical protein
VDAIKSNHAIAFVGSGLSVPRAPSWRELLYELVAEAEDLHFARKDLLAAMRLIEAERFVDAASVIANLFTPHALSKAIVQAMTYSRVRESVPWHGGRRPAAARVIGTTDRPVPRDLRPTESHEILLRLNLQAIITTNYDRLLEAALGSDEIASFSCTSFTAALPIRPWQQFILHLHGDVRYPADIVFSAGHYARVSETPAFSFMDSLLRTCVTLWIGYSHSDPDLAWAMDNRRVNEFSDNFQIVLESDVEMIQMCRVWNINPILLDNYAQLPAFLKQLADVTNARPYVTVPFAGSTHKTPDPGTLNPLGQAVTDRFLSGPLATLPKNVVNPGVVVRTKERQFDPDEVFRIWTSEFAPKKNAIVAAPAAGKTVLLCRFAQWLHDQLAEEGVIDHRLIPIVLFLGPDNLPDRITRDKPFWKQVERWAHGPAVGYHVAETPELLMPWLAAGAVYLLFDGLDEFGARRRGELDELLAQLSSLVRDYGIKVFLTCREVFWSQQIRLLDKDSWDEVGILPFSPEDVERIVPYPGLGRFAYDSAGKPKFGVLNRLLVSFVVALNSDGQSAAGFESRYRLYSEWAKFVTGKYKVRFKSDIPSADWLELFKDTALQLLRNLAVSVSPPVLPDGQSVPFPQIAATGILVPSADGRGVKFYHESINEFFVSRVLVDSFQRVLDSSADSDVLVGLPLAQVDLDFLQVSLYGFLNESLGSQYLRKMRKAVARAGLLPCEDRMVRLIRNLVEYVGMVFEEVADTGATVDWLLGLMRMNELDTVIRYNAARALERIHAWAPKPYFDYMSDWNDRNWSNERKQAEVEKLHPWAVRGYRIKRGKDKEEVVGRKPGENQYLAVLRTEPPDAVLQVRVSQELGELLIQALEQLPSLPSPRPEPGKWRPFDLLLINYSYAWVRWYHPGHSALLEQVRGLARTYEATNETVENLCHWVSHEGFQYR